MILIAEITAFLIYTYVVWYVGRNWVTVNSISDVETTYKAKVAELETLKTTVASEIASGEAKVASLRALV